MYLEKKFNESDSNWYNTKVISKASYSEISTFAEVVMMQGIAGAMHHTENSNINSVEAAKDYLYMRVMFNILKGIMKVKGSCEDMDTVVYNENICVSMYHQLINWNSISVIVMDILFNEGFRSMSELAVRPVTCAKLFPSDD